MSRRGIYTRTGDHGHTSLACGRRLSKDDLQIEAYGTIDELSSMLGVVAALINKLNREKKETYLNFASDMVEWIQERLFMLSTMIATSNLPAGNMPMLLQTDVEFLENRIDDMEKELPELSNFIIPGGSEMVSFIHLARTICRRVERVCTRLNRHNTLNPTILPFLNRLGDYLFVFARWIGYQQGETEKIWLGRRHPRRSIKHFKFFSKIDK